MAISFLERVKLFLTSPNKAFEKEQKTSVKAALVYGFLGLLILAVLNAIVYIFMPGDSAVIGILGAPILFAITLIGGFFGTIIGSLWYHLWAYIFGARQGIGNTIKATFYSNTPTYLLGWIPFVGFVTGIWSIILLSFGLKKLQKLSTARAVGTLLVAVLIPLIIVIIVAVWLVLNYGTSIFGNTTI